MPNFLSLLTLSVTSVYKDTILLTIRICIASPDFDFDLLVGRVEGVAVATVAVTLLAHIVGVFECGSSKCVCNDQDVWMVVEMSVSDQRY